MVSGNEDRKLLIAGFLCFTVLTAINYFAHTPLKFIASTIGLVAALYSARKLKQQFDVPLVFIRRNSLNYWGGAFGGLTGGMSGLYGATRNFEALTFAEFFSELALGTVYLVLVLVLFMGTVLQDIEDGYLNIE